jgi:hypothetical protein
VTKTDWDKIFGAPSTAGDTPRALLTRLSALLAALNPQDLDPTRSSAAGTHEGSILATLRHRTEDLLEMDIECSGDGFASISSPTRGAPDELADLENQGLDDSCADVLGIVTDLLLGSYTLTEYRRGERLICTQIASDSPDIIGSMIMADRWTGLLPLPRRNLRATTRHASYNCQGNPPSWLLSSAIFVINASGLVAVYPHQSHAKASLEAIDIADGEYQIAYDEHGVAYRMEAHLDNGRLVPTGSVDPAGLTAALQAAPNVPAHLAGDPHAYAVHQLASH